MAKNCNEIDELNRVKKAMWMRQMQYYFYILSCCLSFLSRKHEEHDHTNDNLTYDTKVASAIAQPKLNVNRTVRSGRRMIGKQQR